MLQQGSVVAANVALALCLVASQVSAEVFAYPKQGQSQQQFEQAHATGMVLSCDQALDLASGKPDPGASSQVT